MSKSKEIERTRIADRRHQVSRAILAGYRSSRQISAYLDARGIKASHVTVQRDVAALEKQYQEAAQINIEAARGESLTRLTYYQQKLYPKIAEADTKAIRLAKEIEADKNKLLGTNRPAKIAQTDPTGEQEYTGIPPEIKKRMLQAVADEAGITVDAEVIEEIEAYED